MDRKHNMYWSVEDAEWRCRKCKTYFLSSDDGGSDCPENIKLCQICKRSRLVRDDPSDTCAYCYFSKLCKTCDRRLTKDYPSDTCIYCCLRKVKDDFN